LAVDEESLIVGDWKSQSMKNLIAVALVYGGLLVMLGGAVSLIWPLRVLTIRSRATAAVVVFGGVLVFVAGAPAPLCPQTGRGPRFRKPG